MRRCYLGPHACHRKAQSLGLEGKAYVGMAVLSAEAIQAAGSTVTDSRAEFLGHAHISHGIILPRDEPPEPDQVKLLNERLEKIMSRVEYNKCPNPKGMLWWSAPF